MGSVRGELVHWRRCRWIVLLIDRHRRRRCYDRRHRLSAVGLIRLPVVDVLHSFGFGGGVRLVADGA